MQVKILAGLISPLLHLVSESHVLLPGNQCCHVSGLQLLHSLFFSHLLLHFLQPTKFWLQTPSAKRFSHLVMAQLWLQTKKFPWKRAPLLKVRVAWRLFSPKMEEQWKCTPLDEPPQSNHPARKERRSHATLCTNSVWNGMGITASRPSWNRNRASVIIPPCCLGAWFQRVFWQGGVASLQWNQRRFPKENQAPCWTN